MAERASPDLRPPVGSDNGTNLRETRGARTLPKAPSTVLPGCVIDASALARDELAYYPTSVEHAVPS